MDITFKAWISCIWHTYPLKPVIKLFFNRNTRSYRRLIRFWLVTSCLFLQIITKYLISRIVAQLLRPNILIAEISISKHDVLKRNPAHFLTTRSIKMKKSKKLSHNIQALSLLALTSSITFASHAAIVINEIDYDQAGTDIAEFIELFNSGTSAVPLDNYSVDLINGSTSLSYRTIDLSGFNIAANGYFVMCGDTSLVANCDYSFTTTSGWFQNGAPDAVGLYENTNLLDSLSYEGILLPFTEGEVMSISDNNSDIVSIGRSVDGMDINNNLLDFKLGCITPGSANIAGSGNCSTSGVSPVPVPTAIWLFGSGIIGLVGLARRKELES